MKTTFLQDRARTPANTTLALSSESAWSIGAREMACEKAAAMADRGELLDGR
jgi:hypothetical protein